MQLDWMISFSETARHGSLNKAAERLHLTQPAVSGQIRKLEEQLGVRLFSRTPAGVTLTEAGAAALERSRAMLAEWQALQQELGAFREERRIAFGTLPSLASAYVPRHAVLLQRHGIRLDVRVASTSEELHRLLGRGAVEAALLELGAAGRFWAAELFAEPFFAVLPKTHPLAAGASVTIDQLAALPLVVNPPACDIRRRLVRVLGERGLTPRIAVEVAFGEQVLGYVAAGAGAAVVPEIAASPLARPDLAALPISDFGEKRRLALAAPSAKLGELLWRRLRSAE